MLRLCVLRLSSTTWTSWLAHASHVVLGDRLDTLKVLISGSLDGRARRVMAGIGVDEKTARKAVERSDHERSE